MFSVLSSIFSFPLSLAPLNPVILDPKSCLCRLPLDFFPTQHVTPMGFYWWMGIPVPPNKFGDYIYFIPTGFS